MEKGNGNAEYSKEGALNIAEAYHKAKQDGSNPELVKAVEDILGKPKESSPTPQTGKGEGDWSRDVESTANKLKETEQKNPSLWQKIKDAFNKGINKVFGGSLKMNDSEKLSPGKQIGRAHV